MPTKRPNILYIMSDDHASNAISAYGSHLAEVAPTPQIDRIARNGVRMDNCHCCNSICTPSRASILTGQHSHVNGVVTLADRLLPRSRLLPEILQEAGYQTALFGKWHLHCHPRGFDQWHALPGQGHYFDPIFIYPDRESIPETALPAVAEDIVWWDRDDAIGEILAKEPGYVSDVIADKTLRWLDERDPERPFFLCCQHKAPHDFFEYAHRHESYLEDVELPEPSTLFEDEATLREISREFGSTVSERWPHRNAVTHLENGDIPQYGKLDLGEIGFEGRARKAYQLYNKAYLRAVRGIDENVGRVLDYLDAHGLTENTIVLYTSDQGMMLGEHDKIDKRWIFDESQRMPMLIQYPAEIPAGSVTRALCDNTDIAPTLLDFAGLPTPDWMQGRSFRQALCQPETRGKEAVYYRYWMHMAHHCVPAHYGIRTSRYKLIFFYGMKLDATGCPKEGQWAENTRPGFELYDLEQDPCEARNVYHNPAYADVAASLREQLLRLKEEVGDTDERYPELMALQREFFGA